MANHTTGPWEARKNCDVMSGDRLVADCMTGWLREDRANAHLIAAAPEMLEALERIRDESGPFNLGEMRKLVESAIRKARGEE